MSEVKSDNQVKSDEDIIQWAVGRSRTRSKKAYPWHELQEIALAMEHGLPEALAFEQADANQEPLNSIISVPADPRCDSVRVAHLRSLIATTNWPQAERTYDDRKQQAVWKVPS